ncbi:hypothetical protein SNK04_014318 [Fusarium graminearum]
MSVPAYTGPDSSVANGVTTTFPYSFKILSEDDLLVTVNGLVRQLGVHYTVTGVGNESGGNAVFVSPPVANAVVERSRNMPYARNRVPEPRRPAGRYAEPRSRRAGHDDSAACVQGDADHH